MKAAVGAKLSIKGSLECKDKDGRVIKVIEVNSSVPLEQLGLSVEEAQALIAKQHSKPAQPRP